ncbi:DUF4333 domain-containing protein [Amycolatopsis deserti]|uniref:DUF4333 domain-containing protein n=1 Tax=Amycolatopsis deserti TaxID=185696 RepID=UPI00174D06F2
MIRTALVACSAALLLAGCTVTVGATPSLSQETVEQGVSDVLLKEFGHRPDRVDCPGPVDAKPGNSTRCVLTGPDMRLAPRSDGDRRRRQRRRCELPDPGRRPAPRKPLVRLS